MLLIKNNVKVCTESTSRCKSHQGSKKRTKLNKRKKGTILHINKLPTCAACLSCNESHQGPKKERGLKIKNKKIASIVYENKETYLPFPKNLYFYSVS